MSAVMRQGASRRPKTHKAAAPARVGKPKSASKRTDHGHGGRTGAAAGLHPRMALAAAGVVLAGGLVLLLATSGRAGNVERDLASAGTRGLASAGFTVRSVAFEGASRFSVPYILRAAEITRGQPILDLDLPAIQARVAKVGWVKSVRVLRLLPDTLVIAVAERPRLAVWQQGGRARVVDPDGQVIPEADPALFVDLPLIVGDGANEAAGAILPELQARPRLMGRTEALVRVDGRRWDLRLKDGGLIQLPAENEDRALIQLDQLDQQDRLLDLGFERIDLRDPETIAVRPRQPAGPPSKASTATATAAAKTAPKAPAPAPIRLASTPSATGE